MQKKALTKKSAAKRAVATTQLVVKTEKNASEKNFCEDTAFDLDYGELLIIARCICAPVLVS